MSSPATTYNRTRAPAALTRGAENRAIFRDELDDGRRAVASRSATRRRWAGEKRASIVGGYETIDRPRGKESAATATHPGGDPEFRIGRSITDRARRAPESRAATAAPPSRQYGHVLTRGPVFTRTAERASVRPYVRPSVPCVCARVYVCGAVTARRFRVRARARVRRRVPAGIFRSRGDSGKRSGLSRGCCLSPSAMTAAQ